jgi:uncharacterized membrane protein
MQTLANLAYGVQLGRFPLIAVVGFATYGLFGLAALTMVARRMNRSVTRLAFRLHRWIACAALIAATFHLLLGVSVYV